MGGALILPDKDSADRCLYYPNPLAFGGPLTPFSLGVNVEVAKMLRLDRLEELARRHNLVPPRAGQFVDLEPKADESLASLEPKAR